MKKIDKLVNEARRTVGLGDIYMAIVSYDAQACHWHMEYHFPDAPEAEKDFETLEDAKNFFNALELEYGDGIRECIFAHLEYVGEEPAQ